MAQPQDTYQKDHALVSDTAERSVLATIAFSVEGALDQAAGQLPAPDAFYHQRHQHIYGAALALHKEGKAEVDVTTLQQKLKEQGALQDAGGMQELIALSGEFSGSSLYTEHLEVIRDAWYRRRLVDMGQQLTTAPVSYEGSVMELLNKQQRHMDQLLGSLTSQRVATWQDVQQAVYEDVKNISERRKEGELAGIPSGLNEVDRQLGGWNPGELTILAARPGMGKTAMAVKWGAYAASKGHRVGIMQLEMSAVQLGKRILAVETDSLHANQLYKHGLEKASHWEALNQVMERTKDYPLHIVPKPGMTVNECQAEARMMQKRDGIDMLIVDYLQLMGAGDETKRANREQQISEVSRKLKQLAMDLNIPVIALSQLSRAVETRGGNKRPVLSDLRESGSIEQDADQVLFLYRPEYYGIYSDEQGNSLENVCEVIVAKHRNGSLGVVQVGFDDNRVKFYNQGGDLARSATENDDLPY